MSKSQKNINEEKTTAASYIITFYKEVQELTHNYSTYTNIVLELDNKYTQEAQQKGQMEENDRNVLVQVLQTFRYHANKCFLQYECISEATSNQKNKDSIAEHYKKIKKEFMINREDAYNFVKAMNIFLINDIMKHLLEDSQETIDSLYKDDRSE